jgi:hypothetical protein
MAGEEGVRKYLPGVYETTLVVENVLQARLTVTKDKDGDLHSIIEFKNPVTNQWVSTIYKAVEGWPRNEQPRETLKRYENILSELVFDYDGEECYL